METNFGIIFVIAVIFVALMVLGLSITLMRKGHNIQSEVGDNDEMKKRGIKCTSRVFMEEEAAIRGEKNADIPGCGMGSCGTCDDDVCHSGTQKPDNQ